MKILNRWDFWYYSLIAIFSTKGIIEGTYFFEVVPPIFFIIQVISLYASLKIIEKLIKRRKLGLSKLDTCVLVCALIICILFLGYQFLMIYFARGF